MVSLTTMKHVTLYKKLKNSDGSYTNYTVTIATEPSDSENWSKTVTLITPPTDINNYEVDTTDPTNSKNDTLILNIGMKAERRITIRGYLVNGLNPASSFVNDETHSYNTDTHSSATDKKKDLQALFWATNTIYMFYDGEYLEGNTDKMEVQRLNTDGMRDFNDGDVAEFNVTFTFVVGIPVFQLST